MIKAPTKTVQEGTEREREWDYALSDGANREGTDISPKHQSSHSKFWLSILPEIIFSSRARNKPGSTTAKLSKLGPMSPDCILVQIRTCSLGEDYFFKYPQKGTLEELHKSDIPVPFPTLFTSQIQLG